MKLEKIINHFQGFFILIIFLWLLGLKNILTQWVLRADRPIFGQSLAHENDFQASVCSWFIYPFNLQGKWEEERYSDGFNEC